MIIIVACVYDVCEPKCVKARGQPSAIVSPLPLWYHRMELGSSNLPSPRQLFGMFGVLEIKPRVFFMVNVYSTTNYVISTVRSFMNESKL